MKDEPTHTNTVGCWFPNLTTVMGRNVDRTHSEGVGLSSNKAFKKRRACLIL